ncbi:MAG: DUF835 domain-containing protein [Halobacteriota archaeon]|nr:DUF835 domain-containing protein [Halobacteriota archaeon]
MKKILVVDDLPDNVELLAQTLEDFDYDVITAENGREAIDKAVSELPDLILLDVMMPDLDGYSVCDILTSKEEASDIPIIMLTAKTLPEDLKKGFDVGAHDYIKKPFEEVELIARVQAALRLKESRDALKSKNVELLNMAEELNIKNKNLAGLIRDSPVATLSTDLEGRVLTSNPSSLMLLGYSQEEVIGSDISKFLEMSIDYSSLGDMNTQIIKIDGTRIPVTVSTAVLREVGEDKGFIVTLKDLSELKGLIIQPVEEEEEYIDGIDDDPKCWLDDGICYMIDNDDYSIGLGIFIDYVKHRKQGLCITRQSPKKVKRKYNLDKTPIVWLTKAENPEENCISPEDLTKLDSTIKNFIKEANDGFVLMEGLEYLGVHNSFSSVLKFINSLSDAIACSSSRLLLLIDSEAFDTKDYHVLKSDMEMLGVQTRQDLIL